MKSESLILPFTRTFQSSGFEALIEEFAEGRTGRKPVRIYLEITVRKLKYSSGWAFRNRRTRNLFFMAARFRRFECGR